MVQIVKSTSVASLIGLTELARASVQVNTVTFEPVWVFGTASLIYFSLCWPLSLYAGYLERRMAFGIVRKPEKPLIMTSA
jgi:polar amino acid transport system permease protein